jgi:hypothetical protein
LSSIRFWSERVLFGIGVALLTASQQARSSATGSYEAKKPMSGTMAVSFSLWQSQFGETSMTRLMKNAGLPSMTALAYSLILQFSLSLELLSWLAMASFGQTAICTVRTPRTCRGRCGTCG